MSRPKMIEIEVLLDEDWKKNASCRNSLVDKFYLENEDAGNLKYIRALCAACPVRLECYDYAQMKRDKWGIWGGVTPSFRQKQRTIKNRVAPAMAEDLRPALDQLVDEFAAFEREVEPENGEWKMFLFPALRPLALFA